MRGESGSDRGRVRAGRGMLGIALHGTAKKPFTDQVALGQKKSSLSNTEDLPIELSFCRLNTGGFSNADGANPRFAPAGNVKPLL